MPTPMKLTETKTRAKPWRFAFTLERLEALKAPKAGRLWAYDERQPGLAFMVTSNDSKTYYFLKKFAGQTRREKLGKFKQITLDKARDEAKKKDAGAAVGVDPASERIAAKGDMTLAEAMRVFIDVHKKPEKKTWRDDEQRFDLYLKPWASTRLNQITPEIVLTIKNKVAAKTSGATANRVLALMSAIFNKTTGGTLNPTRNVERFAESARQRFLSKSEVEQLLAEVDKEADTTVADFIRLALFTGARRGNVLAMKWEDVNLSDAVWRMPMTKSGQPLTIPLLPQALEVLKRRQGQAGDSPWVLASWGKSGHLTQPSAAWTRITKRAKLPGIRIHDLRRTFGSWMAMSGASLTVVQRALGHLTPSTTAKVYAMADAETVRTAGTAAMALMMSKPAKGKGKGKTKK